MSTKAEWRDEFIGTMTRGLSGRSNHEVGKLCRSLMSMAKTHLRLQIARCNGDWPASNGQRAGIKECPDCGISWVNSEIKKNGCPDCRIKERIRNACEEYGFKAVFQGDPRGATVKVQIPGMEYRDGEGTAVPQ